MGRGKGRAKGIDVTKHFFQSSGQSDRILVQVTPSQSLYMREEDLSPTQGSEAAFASKRDGRAEGAVKLCSNWKQGVCHSYAACSNAHVVAYLNSPSAPPVGNTCNNASGSVGGSMQRTREDGGHSTPQQHPQHHHQQYNHQSNTGPTESNRTMENKAPSTGTHSTLIPAPRSQQANRQASTGESSATANSPGAGTAWGRSSLTNGSQHGNYQQQSQSQSQQVQQYQRHHHHHQQSQQQQQQYELAKKRQQQQQQHGTAQSRSWVTSQRSTDDFIWALSNDSAGEMILASTTPKHSGTGERNTAEIPHMSLHSNSRVTNRGDGGPHFPQSDNINAALGSDAWLNSTLGKSPANAGIWCDVGVGMWDPPSSGVTTNLSTLGTTKNATGEASIFSGRETNLDGSIAPSHGGLWEPFVPNGGKTTVGNNVVAGVSSSSEALKNQLLRELVGAGSEINESLAEDSQLKGSVNGGVHSGPSISFSLGRSSSELPSVLGGSESGVAVYERGGATANGTSAPTRNVQTIQHLMSLLTTE